MVYYFTSEVIQPPVTLFMGVDKYEICDFIDEDLIKWGWPEDIWFHVDKYSSAHVYLRLNFGQTIDDIPSAVLEDAAQLVKANSIEGNKMNDVDVVYTMWSNLKKTQGMEVGQVGFHKDKDVRKIHVAKRINTIVNRLNKTKRTEQVNFRVEREKRDQIEREDKKKLLREQKEKEKAEEKRRKEEAEMRSYNSLFSTCNMTSNAENSGYDSDDFM
ncbi:coiled-coil domain-containing protein 25 isoform X2 [Osmia bicornis bicornis]|uniref:coiled-coil domain-containing protein 25 isoform X2 n=1 Tax=Osmia bicornis bicornis TaxID=1437191 RepID=UPI0010FA1CFB|nr:coiled-coil domain-containing protein 25 isoform X2 [Osmia bicornis bicornis]